MESITITPKSVGLIGGSDGRPGTRNLATSSGESRSQLFQRLRSERVWDAAERLKEEVRAECRSRGLNKRGSGTEAWNSIAATYPRPDAAT